MLAHLHNEDLRCGGCGGYLDVTTGHDQAYMVDEQVCGQCKAVEMWREQHKDSDRPYRRIVAWAISRAEALKAGRRIT